MEERGHRGRPGVLNIQLPGGAQFSHTHVSCGLLVFSDFCKEGFCLPFVREKGGHGGPVVNFGPKALRGELSTENMRP